MHTMSQARALLASHLRSQRNFYLLVGSGALAALSSGLVAPVLPMMLRQQGLALANIGLIFSGGALLPLLLQPLLGVLSDRRGRQSVLGPVELLCGLLLLLVALPLPPLFIALFFGARLALDGSAAPLFSAAVGDVTGANQRATRLSWLSSAASMAYVGALFGSTLALRHLGVSQLVLLAAALILLSGFALLALADSRPPGPAPKRSVWQSTRRGLAAPLTYLRRDRSLAALFLCYFFRAIGMGVFPVYFPLLLSQLGAEQASIGPILGLSWLLFALVQLIGGRLSDRLTGRRGVIGFGLAFMVAGTLAIALATKMSPGIGLTVAVLGWVFLAIPDGLSRPAQSALPIDLAPQSERGRFIGALGTVVSVGYIAAPLLYGIVAQRLSLASAFVVASVALLLSLLALLFVRERPVESSSAQYFPVALVAAVALLLLPAIASADSSYRALATHTDDRITIDGDMSEPAWQRAQKLGDWHQTRIKIGAAPVEATEVRILYDRDNLYFGFHCFDSQPDKIAAYTVQNEAFLHQDDNVTVIIDTFLDHRNAYYFWTNALGVRTDGRILNDGENYNTDWQGEWESKGRIVKDGWVVEIRIPFSNFQYESKTEQEFGILLDRQQVRLQEWSNWTPDGVNSAKVSRYPHLTGLRDIVPRALLTITGYMSGQLSLTGSSGRDASFFGGAGVDLRYAPTNWASLKLTVNPDFAQVDLDQDVLWLDVVQRALPERRPFFLEGSDLFASPIRLFYSRRIAPQPTDRVLVGLLATGKRSGFGFSVFDVQSQEHRPDGTIEDANSAVLRVQRDLWRRSHLSLTALGRFGDQKLGLVGIDTNVSLYEELFFIGQIALAAGPDSGVAADKLAYHLELHRFQTNSEYWLQYDDIGAAFQSPLGYIPYLDIRSIYAHGNYTWFTPWSKRVVARIDFTYDEQWWWSHDGERKRQNRNFSIVPYLVDSLALSFYGQMDYYQGFDNLLGNAGLVLFPNRWDSVTVVAVFGNLYGGTFTGFRATVNRKFGPHLVFKASAFATWSTGLPTNSPLYKDAADGFQWSIYGQLRYQINPNLYGRLTYQRGSAVDLVDLGQIEGQVIDATIGWHYRVASDAFLVYTEQPLQGQTLRRILVKASFTY